MKKTKGLAEKTVGNYDEFIRRFISFAGDLEDGQFNRASVERYIEDLFERELSKATIGTYIRHLKVFVRYLEDEAIIETPFGNKIKVPKQPKKIVKIYTDEEIKIIFSSVRYNSEWLTFRDLSIVSLFLDSGLRLSEVCRIDFPDFDFRSNMLKVHGKGDKERLVPIGATTKRNVVKYLRLRPSVSHDAFFITYAGERISDHAIKLFINKLSRRVGFEISPHKLRHNFATNYCINQYIAGGEVDIYRLMTILGHEDTVTTQRYLHLANQIIIAKTNISHIDRIFPKHSFTAEKEKTNAGKR